MSRRILFLGILVGVFSSAAQVEFSTPFSDGMVLQRDTTVPIWGTASAGEKVTVSFAGQEVSSVADVEGKWRVDLSPLGPSKTGRRLTASGSDSGSVLEDVLVGEVWIVSGQSNCELPLVGKTPHFSDRQGLLVAGMTYRPDIRFVQASGDDGNVLPRREMRTRASWKPFVPENLRTAPSFSAIGVYFALDIHAAIDMPIGLIGIYSGGSNIEAWIPREGFCGVDDAGPGRTCARPPSVLWNALVAPWCPMALRGFLWYQGCANSNRKAEADDWYRRMMHALYDSWSKAFENPDLKLYFAELAPYVNWWDIQTCQAKFAAEEKNADMVTTCDVGNVHDIHPNEKGTVGKRLAALALRYDYGFTNLVADAPVPLRCVAKGRLVELDCLHAGSWWIYHDDWGVDVPFELADADGRWKPARLVNTVNGCTNAVPWKTKGVVDGGGTLVLSADGVEDPVKIRYLYQRPWTGFLYSADSGLPLGPFEAPVEH